ncbi:MAG: EamA family transporter [Patescibacteria group bacterium]|jgi:drug/metabolite transporter (DMT)-like permease
MNWLLIVVIAYALNAVAMAIDKTLLRRQVPHPAAYTFYICALGIITVVLLPFDFVIPPALQMLYNFLAGATFAIGLYLMFTALKKEDASRVTPFIGGLNPFIIFILAWLFLGERLATSQILAFFVILFGTFLISLNFKKGKSFSRAFLIAIPSAIFLAISYTITKYAYLNQSFISAFVWIRLSSVVAVLFLLLKKDNRQAIFATATSSASGSRYLFLTGQACGALSMIMVSWAISIASVSLVNALQGLQYVFLFAIVLTLKRKNPHLLEEDLSRRVYLQKIISIGLIVFGLFILSW